MTMPRATCSGRRSATPTMQRIAIGLAALLLFAPSSSPEAAEQAGLAPTPAELQDCGYVCVFALSVDDQTGTSATPGSARAEAPRSTPIERNEPPPAAQASWVSSMDSR
jgi:hypothetical protein